MLFWGHKTRPQRTTVRVVTQALSEEKSRRLHRPPPRTAHLCVRLERAPLEHARSKCGDRPSLGGRCYGCIGAPRRLALHMLRQHKRLPRTLHTMISGPPLPTLALGRSAKRAFHRASRAARSARSRRHHHQEATCACYRGGSTCRRLGAQPPIDTGRVARGGEQAAAGARAHSAHAIGAERVAQGGDGSQRLCRPAHRRAAPSFVAQRRAASV